jgi:hypothetical protein
MGKADSPSKEAPTVRSKSFKKIRPIYIALIVLAIVLTIGGYIGYQKYDELRQENAKLSDPQEAARQETQRIKDEVARLIDVPQDEDPTIASVVDTTKLADQPFFKKAQNGDKVLMYAQAKRAILYRPSTNKIIEVAPINIGDTQTTGSKTSKPAETE